MCRPPSTRPRASSTAVISAGSRLARRERHENQLLVCYQCQAGVIIIIVVNDKFLLLPLFTALDSSGALP